MLWLKYWESAQNVNENVVELAAAKGIHGLQHVLLFLGSSTATFFLLALSPALHPHTHPCLPLSLPSLLLLSAVQRFPNVPWSWHPLAVVLHCRRIGWPPALPQDLAQAEPNQDGSALESRETGLQKVNGNVGKSPGAHLSLPWCPAALWHSLGTTAEMVLRYVDC